MNLDIYKVIGYFIGLAVVNGITMWIWNMIIPDMFGLKPIGFWQMYGLYIICHFLFTKTTDYKHLQKTD